jgi:outer membrane usher protein FimD/PapC
LQTGFATESSEDLFKKVFGQSQVSKKVSLDAVLKDYYLGSINVWATDGKIEKVSGADLNILLLNKIRDSKKTLYTFPNEDIPLSKLSLKIHYSASELKLILLVPDEDLIPQNSALFADLVPYYAKNAIRPAPVSFGTNYKLEKVFGKNLASSNNYLEGQTDSFLNVNNMVLENQMNYLSARNRPWYRQSSKISYDYLHRLQRFEIGDISYPVIGYQQGRALGGIAFYRDFSLNPYLRAGPTSAYEYEIQSRSLVKTYINGALIKAEYMAAGHYSVKDVPLNNGLNKILVEVTDEFEKKKIFIFNEAGSIDLLAPELSRYSLATGYPALDTDLYKKYDEKNGQLLSGFYQHGINKNVTLAGYLQGNKQYSLLGANSIFATVFGNVLFDLAGVQNKMNNGEVLATTFQRTFFGDHWYSAHTLTTKVEYRSPWFNESGDNLQNRYDLSTTVSYSLPLFEKFNLSVSGRYQNPTLSPVARISYDTSITANLFESHSLSFFLSKSRDDNKVWSTQLYCFLNISFSDQATFASLIYENQSQAKRLSVFNDNGKKIHDLKVSASAEDSLLSRSGSLDLQYNANLADLGVREDITSKKSGNSSSKTSLRFLSSISFVKNKDDFAFSLGRPITNSFVIFKPAGNFKGQSFGTDTENGAESGSDSGLFGESLLSGLTPYQYRRLQLNPTHLEPGHTLGQESYVLFPHYRSGHVFVVGKDNLFVLKGILRDNKKLPLPLKVGFFTTDDNKFFPFFTNREGEFFIEGQRTTKGKIQMIDDGDLYSPYELLIKSTQEGIIDLGDISLSLKENL